MTGGDDCLPVLSFFNMLEDYEKMQNLLFSLVPETLVGELADLGLIFPIGCVNRVNGSCPTLFSWPFGAAMDE